MASGSAPQQLSGSFVAPPALRSVGACNHDVQFYADDAFLLDSLVAFVRKSLGLGGAAIIVATQAHRDGLSQRLEAGGIPLAAAIQQGRYIALDAAQTLTAFMKEGMPDQLLFTRVVGDIVTWAAGHANEAKVAIFGEMPLPPSVWNSSGMNWRKPTPSLFCAVIRWLVSTANITATRLPKFVPSTTWSFPPRTTVPSSTGTTVFV
jgi:hypothetical protein